MKSFSNRILVPRVSFPLMSSYVYLISVLRVGFLFRVFLPSGTLRQKYLYHLLLTNFKRKPFP